jgi:hypothetical protein
MTAAGRTVRLFLVDGNAQSGLIAAEIINWTGRVLVAPRSMLAEVLRREEAEKTGLYILFGDQVETGVRRDIYVGESDAVGRRLLEHSKDEKKDFFERFCLITSSDLNLTKTHVRYLESRVTTLARASGRANVLNGNEPPAGRVPESDVADMEFFLEQLRILLPVLGFDVLRDPLAAASVARTGDSMPAANDSGLSALELYLPENRDGISAKAVQIGDEIVVRAGSLARRDVAVGVSNYAALRSQLIEDGALVAEANGNFLVFDRDVPFSSPSAATAVIYGRNDNGRMSWHVKHSNQTLKAYQNSVAEAAELANDQASGVAQ